jgi:acetyltransferase-like isoleucine patch superfamily enzyme
VILPEPSGFNLHQSLDEKMKTKLKRFLERWLSGFLPYQMLAGGRRFYLATKENRYKPSDFLHCGENVRIESGVSIAAPERLHLGDNVGISQGCSINAVGGCFIGNDCTIGANTTILTIEHSYSRGDCLPYDKIRLVKPVYLEDFVWVGMGVSIAGGVRIGEGAIIGMGSVVFQDVPPLAIVAGNPAKVIFSRSAEDFQKAKLSGGRIDPYAEIPLLMVPPVTKRKFKNELKYLGFDVSDSRDCFLYDKHAKIGTRLMPVSPWETEIG